LWREVLRGRVTAIEIVRDEARRSLRERANKRREGYVSPTS
jgi:hypothetical protein